ncbi:MAG: DUF177 domain-containing protein [Deltaproteobacteria bacterium]|nr:DUF177 domain-containing protein [Deltaproteobacteria bacterium]
MKIRIEDITEEGLTLDVVEEGAALTAVAGSLDFTIPGQVKARLEITKTGADVFVRGSLDAALGFVCGRCLKAFEQKSGGAFNLFFTREAEKAREKELHAGDMDVNLLEGAEFDTSEMLLAQLSLDAPMKPLCNADCKGLCPKCGEELNAGPCKCPQASTPDKRFAKLKDFKVR